METMKISYGLLADIIGLAMEEANASNDEELIEFLISNPDRHYIIEKV